MCDLADDRMQRFCDDIFGLSKDGSAKVFRKWPLPVIERWREGWDEDVGTLLMVASTADGVKCERSVGLKALRLALHADPPRRVVWITLPPIRNADVDEPVESTWDQEKLFFAYCAIVLGVKFGSS